MTGDADRCKFVRSQPLRRLGLGMLAAVALVAPTTARASLPELFGMGGRSSAMAGTGAAYATGFDSVYANPAGLWASGRQLSIGAVYGGYGLSLGTAADGSKLDYPVDSTAGLLFGGAFTLPLGGVLRDRIGAALSLYTPFGLINRAHDPFPDVPRAPVLDGRTQVVSVLLGLGIRLPGGFSIGGGAIALAALVGTITITPDGSGRITSISEQQLTVDYAPILGLRWGGLSDKLALAAVFRGASRSSYRLTVSTKLGDALPIELPLIYFAGSAQYDPLQLGLEVAGRLRPSLLLVAQATWKHWSAYEYPVLPATKNAAKLPLPGFHDTIVPRVAVEKTWALPSVGSLALRGGYQFEWSPAPDPPAAAPTPESRPSNLHDADRHVLSAGLGLSLTGRVPLSLDAYAQGHILGPHSSLGGGLYVLGLMMGYQL